MDVSLKRNLSPYSHFCVIFRLNLFKKNKKKLENHILWPQKESTCTLFCVFGLKHTCISFLAVIFNEELHIHNVTCYVSVVVAQWIRPQTLNNEVPGSNPLAVAVVPLSKALYTHCLVPQKGLKAIGPLVACLQAACFLSDQVKYKSSYTNYIVPILIWILMFLMYEGTRKRSTGSSHRRKTSPGWDWSWLRTTTWTSILMLVSRGTTQVRKKYTERQKKLITSSGRRSLKSMLSKLIMFGHK